MTSPPSRAAPSGSDFNAVADAASAGKSSLPVPLPSVAASVPDDVGGGGSRGAAWGQVVLAAVLMLGTLPGRTQGLGLITEPMLADLRLDRITYAGINLWATLLGSAACLPAGWLIDRFGLRWTTVGIVLLLAGAVQQMSVMAGGVMTVFTLVLLTRALGQSALSVASITTAGKGHGLKPGLAMGGFSVLLSIFFIIAFVVVGGQVSGSGWRAAWAQVAAGLVVVAVLAAVFLRKGERPRKSSAGEQVVAAGENGATLGEALRTPLFWVFAGATALFGLVSSGLGLFNEAVLAERGFDRKTFEAFLGVTTLFALVGQMLCGWLSLKRPLTRLLAVAMFLYAAGLGTLPLLRSLTQLWIFAAVFGVAAGMVTVIFFAIWSQAFGRAQLGRIQGAAQLLTVFSSAIGPLLFAQSREAAGSYAPLLLALTPVVLLSGIAAWFTKPPAATSPAVLA